jgi:hypothetical protein
MEAGEGRVGDLYRCLSTLPATHNSRDQQRTGPLRLLQVALLVQPPKYTFVGGCLLKDTALRSQRRS